MEKTPNSVVEMDGDHTHDPNVKSDKSRQLEGSVEVAIDSTLREPRRVEHPECELQQVHGNEGEDEETCIQHGSSWNGGFSEFPSVLISNRASASIVLSELDDANDM